LTFGARGGTIEGIAARRRQKVPTTQMRPRFTPGQRIRAARSGRSHGIAEVLQVVAHRGELYRVRWREGTETFFVPGPDVEPCDRRSGADRRREDVPWLSICGYDRRRGRDRRDYMRKR
jgi:hypothetical protein